MDVHPEMTADISDGCLPLDAFFFDQLRDSVEMCMALYTLQILSDRKCVASVEAGVRADETAEERAARLRQLRRIQRQNRQALATLTMVEAGESPEQVRIDRDLEKARLRAGKLSEDIEKLEERRNLLLASNGDEDPNAKKQLMAKLYKKQWQMRQKEAEIERLEEAKVQSTEPHRMGRKRVIEMDDEFDPSKPVKVPRLSAEEKRIEHALEKAALGVSKLNEEIRQLKELDSWLLASNVDEDPEERKRRLAKNRKKQWQLRQKESKIEQLKKAKAQLTDPDPQQDDKENCRTRRLRLKATRSAY